MEDDSEEIIEDEETHDEELEFPGIEDGEDESS